MVGQKVSFGGSCPMSTIRTERPTGVGCMRAEADVLDKLLAQAFIW